LGNECGLGKGRERKRKRGKEGRKEKRAGATLD
jgi:hypothetical protein